VDSIELSVTPPQPRERADAARNRVRVLAAAQALFAERGVALVTMDDVAARAGVGKGTLYRRFGDKSGLAMALLDERERDLQGRILTGPGPLGPVGDADPAERLAAFATAYLEFLEGTLDLVLLSQTSSPGARHRSGAHAFWRTHCRLLLQAADAPDPAVRAEVLLAALSGEQVRYWRESGAATEELTGALARLAGSLCLPPSGRPAERPDAEAAEDSGRGPAPGGPGTISSR
jgi:AcrR family transcriptional regulator